ncbi:MAG: NADH-quinone oxidoreductase subunit H [Opitutaceae bacterium]|nr:NADH-quinone oxidoreductase subunit H [Opitutaceae bacterium]
MALGLRRPRLWLGLTLVATAAGLAAALVVLLGGVPAWEWRGEFLIGGEKPHLLLDAISALFLALLSVLGGAGAAYSRDYWSDTDYPKSAGRGRLWWSALVLMMGLVLTSANGLHFLFGWELFTVAAYFLITLENRRRRVRSAGWLYLAASHVGTLCLFAFFALVAERTSGSWDLGPHLRAQAGLAPLFWLALVGFGVKAGMFPLHVWLPSAHANAPSHVSAMLSGMALKMGIYGLVRFSGWLPLPPQAGWVVIGLGAVGALFGIAFAFAQNDFKRLLAYCSVENIGVILVGLGGAMLAAAHGDIAWGRLALAGALLHIWNHGLFKALLFFGAGSVLHATGTREMSRLGGLWHRMPWTAGLFTLGAVAVSGLPPLNGFVSEWLVYLGLFEAGITHGPAAWAAMPVAIVLGMAGALALASFVKAGTLVFCGAPRTKRVAHAHEAGPWMLGPMLALAGACVTIGLAPAYLWPVVARVCATWNPAWAFTGPAPAPLATLGAVHVALAVLALAAAAGLWWRARANGLRHGLTWDCGYAAPTARMQYTGGSFAGIAAGWFGWLLQTEASLHRPRGLLPERAHRVERVPETVLERLIGPVAAGALRVSTAVRRLQHGRLQAYILYLVVGLAALGVLVFLEGTQ